MKNLNARMNAEGLNIAAIEAAIVECGNKFRTDGWVKPSDDLKTMTSEDVIDAIYPRLFRINVRHGVGYVFGNSFTHTTREEFCEDLKVFTNGTLMECEIEGEYPLSVRHVLVKKTNGNYAIIAEYDHFEWEVANTSAYFLPAGIRAAVAEKLGVDFNSTTFHQAFDAIVEGNADYL